MTSKKSPRAKRARVSATGKKAVTELKKRILGRANGRRFLFGGGIALVLVAGVISALFLLTRKPVVAFYDVPATVRSALVAQAAVPGKPGSYAFRFRDLDPAKPLAAQLRSRPRPALVFCEDGAAASELAKSAIPTPEAVRRLMPSAMRKAGFLVDGSVETAYGLPLLLDHFELAYSKGLLSRAGKMKPETLQDLEAAAKAVKKPTVWPIVCAGAQDRDLLMLAGSLTEALGGEKAWDQVVAALRQGKPFAEVASSTPLRDTLRLLVGWRRAGILHPEWFRMKDADILAFMENENAAMILMPLSTHRTVPLKSIEKYDSTMIPAASKTGPRSFTVPVYVGLETWRKRPDQRVSAFLERLAQAPAQRDLGGATGLAPVNSTAEVVDRQASDVRFWTAASNRPLPDLGRAAFSDPAQRSTFAETLRAYIEANGEGFGE